jgi:hypothetical protein
MPGVPVVPGVPGLPGNPGVPLTPCEPVDPALPGKPGRPGVPLTPWDPVAPGAPGRPGVPDTPGVPLVPGVPGKPGDPGVPETAKELTDPVTVIDLILLPVPNVKKVVWVGDIVVDGTLKTALLVAEKVWATVKLERTRTLEVDPLILRISPLTPVNTTSPVAVTFLITVEPETPENAILAAPGVIPISGILVFI